MRDIRLSDTTLQKWLQTRLPFWHLSLQRTIQPQNFSVPGEIPAQHLSIILGSIFNGWVSLQQFNSSNSRNLNGSQESALAQKKSCCFHSPITSWCSTAEAPRHPLEPRLGVGVPWRGRGSCPSVCISHLYLCSPNRQSFFPVSPLWAASSLLDLFSTRSRQRA